MAKVACPQCGKDVDSSEGYCVYCGYTFDDGQLKSPFASAYNQAQADGQFDETSGGSPVIRFDSNSYADSVPMSSSRGSSGGELMFGIGLSRILALFFAGLVILSMLVPFVTARISINKSMIPQGTNTQTLVKAAANRNFNYNDDGTYITMSRSVSLIQSPNYFLYLMAACCVAGIVFAIKGKPAGYLLCSIGGALLGVFNYLINFSSIDAVLKSNSYSKLASKMGQYGISLTVDKGAGSVLLLIGAIGMIVAAVIFINNHAAYDE